MEDVKRRLPEVVREAAEEVPTAYYARPTKEMRTEGLEGDLLGLFVGPNRLEEWDEGGEGAPPEILLFLENIWEEGGGNEEGFREEVRVTYLHELGHYLGLEEEGLEARGLE